METGTKSSSKPIVSLKNVSFAYPGDDAPVQVIKSLSLDIAEGEFVAVLGRNGSGKSTLAKLISMVNSPDSGTMTIGGRKICAGSESEDDVNKVRRDVGMVFQNPDNQLVATIVEEDVAFGCENLGVAPEEIRRRVDESLAAVGMSEYARSSVYKLSGGQKQRVAIAGALAMKRKMIVFDESTAMLDPSGRREVMSAVEELNRNEGVTVMFITHYMNEAALADRVIVMDGGRIIMDGVPKKVFSNIDTLRSAGLDVPQTIELLEMIRSDGYDVPLDAISVDECAEVITELARRLRCSDGGD